MTTDPAYLQVGRVTLLGTKFTLTRFDDGILLEGHCITKETFRNGSLIARAWESDLKAHKRSRDLIPVFWERREEFDGYYRLRDVELQTRQPYGNYAFMLDLEYALPGRWSRGDIRFESRLIGAVKTNDHSITTSQPLLLPPPHKAYEPTAATTVDRDVYGQGLEAVYLDVDVSDTASHPRWTADPRDYLTGRTKVIRRDPLYPQEDPIAGESIRIDDPEDIGLDNGICRFALVGGKVQIEFWDSTAWRVYTLDLRADVDFTDWSSVSIRRNQFERTVLRYQGGTNGRYGLSVSMRPGERGVTCVMDADVSSGLGIRSNVNMNVSAPRMIYSSADANGHKLMFVSTRTFTTNASVGLMQKNGTQRFDVGITNELSGAPTNNQAAALQSQYFAAVRETVKSLPA